MSGAVLPLSAASQRLGRPPGRPRKATAPRPGTPAPAIDAALLDMRGLAQYLGNISVWTAREIVASGAIPRVRLTLPDGRELRMVRVTRADADRYIAASKERL